MTRLDRYKQKLTEMEEKQRQLRHKRRAPRMRTVRQSRRSAAMCERTRQRLDYFSWRDKAIQQWPLC